jgi:hypothetical protein
MGKSIYGEINVYDIVIGLLPRFRESVRQEDKLSDLHLEKSKRERTIIVVDFDLANLLAIHKRAS